MESVQHQPYPKQRDLHRLFISMVPTFPYYYHRDKMMHGHDDTDDCEADDDDTSTHWHECRQGECMNVLVWDVSRQSVVSSLVAVYKVEL